jgi:hypothetical protein
MGMSQYERPPGADVIYEFIAILVIQPGAPSSLNEKRRSPNRLKGAYRTIDASGQVALGFFKKLL